MAINETQLAAIRAVLEKERQQMNNNSGTPSQVQERTIGADLDRISSDLGGLEEVISQILDRMGIQRPEGEDKLEGIPAGITRIDERFNTLTVIERRMSEMRTDLEHLQNELTRV